MGHIGSMALAPYNQTSLYWTAGDIFWHCLGWFDIMTALCTCVDIFWHCLGDIMPVLCSSRNIFWHLFRLGRYGSPDKPGSGVGGGGGRYRIERDLNTQPCVGLDPDSHCAVSDPLKPQEH